ncbi:MAG TPA: hypothetical protein VNX65_04150 [Patescibacteria group bacterium]|jgi:hypothetical protein|nr:hypothetical protein [Patescibacteria group bacterium]
MNIYLDIDGVLLANELTAAPHAEEFLTYILDNYPDTTHWLTTHCWKGINRTSDALAPAFSKEILDRIKVIKPTDWNESKTDAIDFTKPFLWFDDDLYPEERATLEKNNALKSWVEVDLGRDPDVLRGFIELQRGNFLLKNNLQPIQ